MNSIAFLGQVSIYNEQYNNVSSIEQVTYAKVVLFILIFLVVSVLLTYILLAALLSRIFKKADVPTWKAWIPIYNNWTLLELGGQKGWWAALVFVPIVNIASIVYSIIAMYHVGRNFGKEGSFVLFAIFVPLIWFFILATDTSKWKKTSKTHYTKPLSPLT